MASGKTKLSPTQPRRIELSQLPRRRVFSFLIIGSVMSLSVWDLKNYLLVAWIFLFFVF